LPLFAQRGKVDVILEPDRQAERSLELARERPAVDAGDVLDDPHDARPALDYPGDADDDGIDAVGIESRRLRQRLAQALDRLDRLLRFGDLQLDILAGANLAGEITDRAADEARTEVEPEHDRCLRHGLEVDGAVAGAVRSLGRLADELGLA